MRRVVRPLNAGVQSVIRAPAKVHSATPAPAEVHSVIPAHAGIHARFAALAAVVLFATPCASGAQQAQIPVQAGVTIERDTVTVGDVVRLVVRVRAPRGATINFPAAVDSLGPVQSLEPPTVRDGADSASAADRIATYRLAAWDVGHQPIKLGDVLVQTDDGDRRVALVLPSLFVRSVLPADTTLRVPKPARPLLAVRAPVPWWWWALAALAAALVGLLAWWIVRRRRATGGPTGDPFLDADASFDRVERLRLIEAGEPGRHAALMTDVVRRYLAERLASASLAQTSGELLAAVRGAPTVPVDALRRLLDAVDPVKFGNAPLADERARAMGEDAKAIVREEHARAQALAVAETTTEKERAA